MTRWASLEEAVQSIPDGAWLAPGGFMLSRAPMALVFALIRTGKRKLQIASLPNPLPAELLVAAGCASRVEMAFSALSLDGRVRPMPCLQRAIERGTIAWAEHDGYRLVQRLRASAMGLPFLPAPDVAEASALSGLEPVATVVDPFTGARVPVEPPFRPDVALLHARAADDLGNLWIEDPTTDVLMASAAARVIATAEERVRRLPRVTIPSFQVQVVAEAPRGAWPTGCPGLYPHDEALLTEYLAWAEQGREKELIEARMLPRSFGREAA